MMYKVTFLFKGYVQGVMYQEADSAEQAVEIGKMYMSDKYTKVRVELATDGDDEEQICPCAAFSIGICRC